MGTHLQGMLARGYRSITGQPEPANSTVSKVQEITKLVNDLARSNGFGTDYQLQQSLRSLPDVEKAPQALHDINTWFRGKFGAVSGEAQAAAAYQAKNGPNSNPAFKNEYLQAFDPRIFQWNAQGPNGVRSNLQQLDQTNPADGQAIRQKYAQLKALGAL